MDEYLAEMDAADGEPDDGDDAAPATTAPVAAPSVPTPAAPTVAPPAPTPAATTVAPTAPTPAAPTTAPVVPALSALNGIAALERPRPVVRVASVLLLWKSQCQWCQHAFEPESSASSNFTCIWLSLLLHFKCYHCYSIAHTLHTLLLLLCSSQIGWGLDLGEVAGICWQVRTV